MKQNKQNNNTKKHLSDSDCLTNPADVRQYGKFPQVRPRWSGH